MNKREVTWLIVRLIGAYFGYAAIVALFTLVSTIWMIFSVPSTDKGVELSSQVTPTSFPEQPGGIPGIQEPTPRNRPDAAQRNANKPDPAADEAKRAIFKRILWDLFVFLLLGGAAYYLLFQGGLFFNVLMREKDPGKVREKEPESILLNLSE